MNVLSILEFFLADFQYTLHLRTILYVCRKSILIFLKSSIHYILKDRVSRIRLKASYRIKMIIHMTVNLTSGAGLISILIIYPCDNFSSESIFGNRL